MNRDKCCIRFQTLFFFKVVSVDLKKDKNTEALRGWLVVYMGGCGLFSYSIVYFKVVCVYKS